MAAGANTVFRLNRKFVWPALILAVATDRVVSFVLTLLLSSRFGLPAKAVAIGAFVHALPGVALQLAVIPLVLKAIGARRSVLFERNDR